MIITYCENTQGVLSSNPSPPMFRSECKQANQPTRPFLKETLFIFWTENEEGVSKTARNILYNYIQKQIQEKTTFNVVKIVNYLK